MHGAGTHLPLTWDLLLVHESPNASNFLKPWEVLAALCLEQGSQPQRGLGPRPLLPSVPPLPSASALRVCLPRQGTALISRYQGTDGGGFEEIATN